MSDASPPAMPVSILLLMKNERKNLEQSWPLIAAQDYPGDVEYIYIDSGSTDGTVEFMAERGVAAHHIPNTEFHHGRTRNLACSIASHPLLVFLSGDARPMDTTWLRRLLEPFDDPRVGATYGRQVAPEGTSPLRTYGMCYEYSEVPQTRDLRTLAAGEKPSLGWFRMSNANAAVRKELWQRFPFHEHVIMSEDVGMCFNILMHDMKVAYVPEAAVWHVHDRSLWYEFQKAFDSAVSIKRMGILGNPALGSETRYGIERVRNEWAHWMRRGQPVTALQGLGTSLVKYCGVQLGKHADLLPRALARHISAGVEKMYE